MDSLPPASVPCPTCLTLQQSLLCLKGCKCSPQLCAKPLQICSVMCCHSICVLLMLLSRLVLRFECLAGHQERMLLLVGDQCTITKDVAMD